MKKLILLTAFLAINAFALPRTTSPGMIMTGASGVIKAGVGGVLEGSSTTSDLPEGSNLYYTSARFDAAFDTRLALKTTANLTEGSNLYFTNARAQAAISASSPLTYSSGVVGCQTAGSSQAGCLSSANWTTFNNKFGSVTYTPSATSRALNANFTPSATNARMVFYSIAASCSATLAGGQTSTIELRSDTSATPTTVRSTVSVGNTVALAVAITVTNTQTAMLSYLVPPGHNVRLVSSGTCTGISIVSQSEVEIAFAQ